MVDRRRGGAARTRVLISAILSACVPLAQASAQTQTAGGLDQLGIRTERWNLFPSLSLSAIYDDNVFAVPDDSAFLESDVFFVLSPEVTAEANTRRHALAITAGAQIGRYTDLSDQDFNDFDVGLNGRWDISRTFDLGASFNFARTTEDQSDPDRTRVAAELFETTSIKTFSGGLVARQRWQRAFARARVGLRRQTFEELDGVVFAETSPGSGLFLPTGDTVNVNADRDRTDIPLDFRIGYDLDRDFDIFVGLAYRIVRFDEPEQFVLRETGFVPVNGQLVATPVIVDTVDGQSQDFETLGIQMGTAVDFDRLVTGEFAVGAQRRFEEADSGDDEFAFSFDADLDWTLSPRSSLGVSGSQGFEPATGGGSGGSSLVTRLGLDLSYALSRQFSLAGNVGYRRDNRTGGGRTDDEINAGVSASYAINRYASLSAGYQFRQRTSTDAAREFDRNRVFLTVTGRY